MSPARLTSPNATTVRHGVQAGRAGRKVPSVVTPLSLGPLPIPTESRTSGGRSDGLVQVGGARSGYEERVNSDATDHFVRVRGASEHNLRNVDVDIPRDA